MPKKERVKVSQQNIDDGVCNDGRHCPIRLGVKDSLDLGHGYCHVDATGISITRNGTHREKSFIVRTALEWLKRYDEKGKSAVSPFEFWCEFYPIRKVYKITPKQRARYTERAKTNGNSKKRYRRSRLIGVSFSDKKKAA